jgi:hypothetical protein
MLAGSERDYIKTEFGTTTTHAFNLINTLLKQPPSCSPLQRTRPPSLAESLGADWGGHAGAFWWCAQGHPTLRAGCLRCGHLLPETSNDTILNRRRCRGKLQLIS